MMPRLSFLIGAAALSLAGCQTTTAARPTTWEQVEANCAQQHGTPATCKCLMGNLSKTITVERYQALALAAVQRAKPGTNDWQTMDQATKSEDEFARLSSTAMKPCSDLMMKRL